MKNWKNFIDQDTLRDTISLALNEDMVEKDITTQALNIQKIQGVGKIYSKSKGVLAGLEIAKEVFHFLDPDLEWKFLKKDGEEVKEKEAVAEVRGKTSSLLQAERVALNFLMRLSGIATETRKYVERAKLHQIDIYDTRKTTPGLRPLEKYAVSVGGGKNHRMNLKDQILIKENHIRCAGSIQEALNRALSWRKKNRKHYPNLKIEIEVESFQELEQVAPLQPDIIMLDNMKGEILKKSLAFLAQYPQIQVEVSGGIHLENLQEYLLPGIHRIAIGSLTHSYKAMDFSFLLEEVSYVHSR
ncbi:MAG: carboxylating nicotinate-nucleotide diphosphorylase [Planctomycetota bacterium]|nr:MAG: carboxylating nicotinate-nucleotide diphosphorylase [Planctomycetota bacterium]